MSTNSMGRAMLVGGLMSVLFAACAQGEQLTGAGGVQGGAGGSSPTGGTGAKDTGPHGMIGSPCKTDADCLQGACTKLGPESYCSVACPPPCPSGTYCSTVNGGSVCVPDLDQECIKCNGESDCKLVTDACLKAPLGDRFCARDCSADVCPNGFTCVDSLTYESAPPDAGADAGKDAGGDAGDAGTDAGADAGVTPSGPRWCVPDSGYSCPCNGKRDGVSHACEVANTVGTCTGTETCNGKTAQWVGCTASTPVLESCNGKDDDCDGVIDNGDPDALCAGQGPKPPHGAWACNEGACALGACDPGWTAYPFGDAMTGCACQLEMGEPNGTCGAATPVGMVTDVGGTPLTIQGTLSSANDVDVWTFDAVDVDETTTNSYHVAIAFTAPTLNTEFVMDVMRGDPCSDTPTGPSSSITAYDWCVNGTDGATPPTGEAACGPMDVTHCGGSAADPASTTHTAKYYVRVHRAMGVVATCTTYTISVTAQGGACDFTQKCP